MNETLKAPTPAQIDALINDYAKVKKDADAAATLAKMTTGVADEVKAKVVAMVETYGFRHTEKSKRLSGLHTMATTTTATRVSIDDAAVEEFRAYLGNQDLTELSGRFFRAHTTYTLIDSPIEVLKELSLGARIRNKISSLIALCFLVKTNAPSLKIETVTPAEP